MGQSVIVRNTVIVDDVLLIDTDRSFTGQDGEVITPDRRDDTVAGRLARGIFDLQIQVEHVYILQNTVSVRRTGGWDDDSVSQVEKVTTEFLRFYED